MLKRLDLYIIKKFLGTFFLAIVLVMTIAIVFDVTEKMDDFFEEQVPFKDIVLYYLDFIPYYMNMFAPLFIFISVIFFTSKMAGNSEIIAILASGVSYRRLMVPYFTSAMLLFLIFFIMGGYVIPPANGKLLDFLDKYNIQKIKSENARNIQMMLAPGSVLYIETFQMRAKSGYRTGLEYFEDKRLVSRVTAERIRFDGLKENDSTHVMEPHWHFENYTKRRFEGLREEVTYGARLDTILPLEPEELFITAEQSQQMTNPELKKYINQQRLRGAGNIEAFETELHKRYASPIGVFIMTLLAVTMSSRKVRGGMGKNLGVGLALSAIYVLFSTVSTTFTVNGVMSPFMAVWLPNFIFLAIGMFLYTRAPK